MVCHVFARSVLVACGLALVLRAADADIMRPMNISLGNVRPEGITEGPGSTLYVGRLLFGGVVAIDVETGTVDQVVPDADGRGAAGMTYYKGTILVAGGGGNNGVSPAFYAYDAKTGADQAVCPLGDGNGFINDVVVEEGKAYITDTLSATLYVADAEAAMAGECKVTTLALPEEYFGTEEGVSKANGIVAYGSGFIIASVGAGAVFYVEPNGDSANATQIIADGEAEGADGLVVLDDVLYVNMNRLNQLGVWSLVTEDGSVTAVKMGELTSPLYMTPTTSAVYDGVIYSCNARFGDLRPPAENERDLDVFEEEFAVIGVRNVFGKTHECKSEMNDEAPKTEVPEATGM